MRFSGLMKSSTALREGSMTYGLYVALPSASQV